VDFGNSVYPAYAGSLLKHQITKVPSILEWMKIRRRLKRGRNNLTGRFPRSFLCGFYNLAGTESGGAGENRTSRHIENAQLTENTSA
jgi:hypothetical protein